MMSMFFIGFLIATLPIDILAKPFSYCLPGHRKVPRKFIFSTGVAINLLASLIFLLYPVLYLYWPHRIAVICSAFFAGMTLYWLVVGSAFIFRNLTLWMPLLWFSIFGGRIFDLHIITERVIVEEAAVVILVGALSSLAAWLWLGSADRARRYCAVPWVGFFDAWNQDKMQRYRRVRAAIKWDKLKKHPSPWVETFFLGRMNRHDYISAGRYIWGGLYAAFGIALSQLSQWKEAFSGVFLALVLVCLLGYMGPAGINMLFFMPGFIIAQMRLPVYSSMLISGGRNERYRCAITLVITTALLFTAMVIIMAALSVPLAAIMPDITLRGITLAFYAMNIELFFVPLLMIPIVFTIQLIFYRKPFFMMLLIILLFILLFMVLFVTGIVWGIFWHKQLSGVINPIYIVILVALSWILFLLVLRYVCMRRCLVGQGKR